MGRRYDADVIIVGTGPAGATTARTLAEKGVSVLSLERRKLPRYKPCGGALTLRTLCLIDLDITPVVEAKIMTLVIYAPDGDRFTLQLPKPLIVTVMRDRFDAFLTEAAVSAGAKLKENSPVVGIHQDGNGVTVMTPEREYRCRLLVGADGANSFVASALGLKPSRRAVSLVVEMDPQLGSDPEGAIRLFFPSRLGGYGWSFPKADHLSAGIYSLAPSLPHWGKWLHLSLSVFQAPRRWQKRKGQSLPLLGRGKVFHRGNVVLVGDAAGFVDPFMGEGISWAIQSGKMAGEAVARFLDGEKEALADYTLKVRAEIIPEFQAAQWFASLVFSFPSLACRWFLRRGAILRNFARLLSGNVSYRDLWRKTFQKAYRILCR